MINETQEQIVSRLTKQLMATPPYSTINLSPSAVGLWSNFLSTMATEFYTQEQLQNTFQTEIELTSATSAPESAPWIRSRVLLFQYDAATNPAAVLNSDFSVGYAVRNTAFEIITQCAVVGNGSGGVLIKVTTATGPLSGPQLVALLSYLDTILGPDIDYTVINAASDLLQMLGTVFYNGQYSGSILADVTAAINSYLAALPFNGIIKLSSLVNVVKMVTGVTDFLPVTIGGKPDGGIYTYMVNASAIQSREYQTTAGYITIDGSLPLSTSLTFSIDDN